MKKTGLVPKAAPNTTLEAYGRVLDLSDMVNALRVAGMSDLHSLQLPEEAVRHLVEAHQALLAAQREIEKAVQTKPRKE